MTMGPFVVGSVVGGRYRLDRRLGQGSHGQVFAAFDLSARIEVALKFLASTAAPLREAEARFERELRVVRELRHPNIVRGLGCGKTPNGALFLVFELLTGETLAARIQRRGHLGIGTTACVGEQILKALWAAHDQNVIHRDIKPENVFLSQFAGISDFARILDFGVAHIVGESGPALTRTNHVVGTPPYMAPEQVLGKPVDARTDLYALGLVLAECLEGTAVLQDSNAVRAALRQAAPEKLELGPRTKASPLARVIEQAIEKDPARRPQSARQMLHMFPLEILSPSLRQIEIAATELAEIPSQIPRDENAPHTIRMPPAKADHTSHAPAKVVLGQPSLLTAPLPVPTIPLVVPPRGKQVETRGRWVAILAGALLAALLVAAGGYLVWLASHP